MASKNSNQGAYFSAKVETHIHHAYAFGSRLAVFRFRWNKVLGRPEETKGTFKTLLCCFNLITQLANLIFVYTRTWQVSQQSGTTPTQKLVCQCLAIYWTYGVLLLISLVAGEKEVSDYAKQTVIYLLGTLYLTTRLKFHYT